MKGARECHSGGGVAVLGLTTSSPLNEEVIQGQGKYRGPAWGGVGGGRRTWQEAGKGLEGVLRPLAFIAQELGSFLRSWSRVTGSDFG